jgi:predicted P-loop ATPase
MMVLEGPQGRMKSTIILVLAGEDNFSDQTILGRGDKEQQELVAGVWFYEIPELAGMPKAEIEKVKAFITRTHDRARGAYERHRVDTPRRCVFIGTTNEDTYLRSQTGNRRFWPIKVGSIDIRALREDRDQLLAEAATVEATGIRLVLPPELWDDARAAQDERLEHDPWDDMLARVKGTIYPTKDGLGEEERVSSEELLKVHLGIPAERATWAIANRLKSVLRRLGWKGPDKLRFGTDLNRGYTRAISPANSTNPLELTEHPEHRNKNGPDLQGPVPDPVPD